MSVQQGSDECGGGPYWAPDLPLLDLRMLLPRQKHPHHAFPFNHASVEYVHFARNAIYALVKHFGLVGADVLVPAYFHGVEVEALVAGGAVPRFFPVRSGMRVDPDDVIQCIRPETRAVYLIHYLGFPGPVEVLQRICRERGLLLIEDCALALLSMLGDQPLGSFGDASVYCLYKTLPTLDGGAVVLRHDSLGFNGVEPPILGTSREIAVSVLRSFERRSGGVARACIGGVKAVGKRFGRRTHDQWVPVGTQDFNARDSNLLMSAVSHTVLAAQDLKGIIAARRRNFLHLQSLLGELTTPLFDHLPEGVCPLFYPFVTQRKVDLWRRLNMRGVQAVLFWLPRQFASAPGEFPDVDELRETVLELPCHQDMTAADIERMAQVVRHTFRAMGG